MMTKPTYYLTDEQVRIIRTALADGATRDEAARLAGITRSRLDTRLRDQLRDLRVGQGRRERRRNPPGDPTPAEIAVRAAAVRSTWPPERWGVRQAWTVDDPHGHGSAAFPLRRC